MSDVPADDTTADLATAEKRGFTQKALDGIERLGNKVPHPAIIFLLLCALVIVLSHVLYLFDVKATYEVVEAPPDQVQVTELGGTDQPYEIPHENYAPPDLSIQKETTHVESLLTGDGVRFLFGSFVNNFANFSVVAVILVAMAGVGVAEEAGLMAALIRKLVNTSPPKFIPFIIIFVGILSSIATDAGYLILIPLGAAAFLSVGRHPLAGLAAAYAGVSAAFAVNLLITPIDGLITEITNEAIHIVDPNKSIDLTSNLWFSIGSTFFVALIATFVTVKIVEPRLGTYEGDALTEAEENIPENEPKGLRYALYGMLAVLIPVALLTFLPSAPLRNPVTGSIFNDSPFMDSLILIITLAFLAAGIGYGVGVKTIHTSVDVINAIVKTFAGLSGLIFLLLIISQFIAYFNFSQMPTVLAVGLADVLENWDIGPIWLLIGLILVIALLDILIPGVVPKWAIFAPIFIPLFMRLGVAPQTVLAAYRVGDSPMNVITPLMVYLPFIVLVAQRYRKDAGIGTIISLMLPYTIIILVAWTVFFVIWYLLGIPVGPGYPVQL